MVSVVLNELFLMPSILFPAKTEAEGATISFASKPTAAAAPAIATPAKNLRRFKYRLFGVISEERMSPAFLISIGTPPGSTRLRPRRICAEPCSLFFHQWDARNEEKLQTMRYWLESAQGGAEPTRPLPGLLAKVSEEKGASEEKGSLFR